MILTRGQRMAPDATPWSTPLVALNQESGHSDRILDDSRKGCDFEKKHLKRCNFCFFAPDFLWRFLRRFFFSNLAVLHFAIRKCSDLNFLRLRFFGTLSSRAGRRGRFKRGGFPIWTCPSFVVLFLSILGLSRFFRDFTDLFSGISRFVLFLFLGLLTAPTRNSPERVCNTIWTFPE